MTEDHREQNVEGDTIAPDEEPPQYGIGPFSIREVALAGTWLVAFVVSFFPIYGVFGAGPSVWSNGIDWVLTIGVPTVAVFLLVLRRLSPQGIRRVGSLGIDQFASVAFSVAAVLWFTTLWNSFLTLANQRVFVATWVVWVEFFLMLAGVFLTVFAPFIAPFEQDFRGRPETTAHRNARPVRALTPRPAPAVSPAGPAGTSAYAAPPGVEPSSADDGAPAGPSPFAPAGGPEQAQTDADAPAPGAADGEPAEPLTEAVAVDPAAWEPAQTRESFEHVETPPATAEPAEAVAASVPRHQAFWALVPEERDVVDEIGIPVFRIGPTAWALVIEDRGEVFVVRHEDGRIGYLHDVSGVTRG